VTPRRLIVIGALVTVSGLAIAGTAPIAGVTEANLSAAQQMAGGVVALVGWAALGWGVHRFGRAKEE